MLNRNGGAQSGDLASETGGSGSAEEVNNEKSMSSMQMGDAAAQRSDAGVAAQAGPQVEGRRTQLKILREHIQTLSKDVGNFRKSHEGSTKKLEKQIASLRSELASLRHSKDAGKINKSHEAGSKRLQREVAALRKDLASLKGDIAKDAARSRAKQEAMLSKILAKVSKKKP